MPVTLYKLTLPLLFILLASSFFVQANAASSESVTLQLKWRHQFQFAGFYAAIDQGYYQQEGLQVTLRERHPGINVLNEVTSGRADYGVGGIGLLAEYARGSPVRALAAIFQHDALVLVSKAQSGIISPYEMIGKRLMFDHSAGNDAVFLAMFADAGISPEDYQFIAQDQQLDSLINDRVDVMSIYRTDQLFTLAEQGVPVNIINPQSYGFDFYGDIIFTGDRELRNHPGRADRFRRATLKGWRYALDNPDKIIDLIINQYGSQASRQQLQHEAREIQKLILPELIPLGQLDPARLRHSAQIYERLNIAPALSESQIEAFIYQSNAALRLTPEEQSWLNDNPVIKLGIDRDFAPYEWMSDKGHYQGLAAEYIQLLQAKLGVEFEIIADKPWHEIIAMAQRGELDMLSCLNMSPERSEYLLFSQPYITNPVVIVNANRFGYIGSLDNLKGKTVAVEKNYHVQESLAQNHPDIKLLLTDTTIEALKKVATGEADAYVGDAAYANYAIKQANLINLQFSGQTRQYNAYRMGVNPSHPELQSIINKVLNTLSVEERQSIEQNWMGLTINHDISRTTIINITLSILAIILAFAVWIFRLKQSGEILARNESKLRNIVNASPIPHVISDGKHKIHYMNQAFAESFGFDETQVPNLDVWFELAYPDPLYRLKIKKMWDDFVAEALQQPLPYRGEAVEVKILTQQKQARQVLISSTVIKDGNANVFITIFYDISERKLAEEQLKLSGRVFHQAHEGILITNPDGRIVDVNPAFCNITGYTREEVVNQQPSLFKSGKHSETFYRELWLSLIEKGYWQGEIWNRRKNGELIAELLTISTLTDDQGETLHYLGLFSDITEIKEQQHALEMMAHFDMLTQLPNRTLFADRFQQAIAHSIRQHSLLGVVFLDLDGFKPINDNYGHEIGDQVLIEVAQRIKACIRLDDTASRLGGDEFAILLNDISSVEHCERLVSRLLRTIQLPYRVDGDTIQLGASMGVTLYPLDQADADTLLRHADQAMYQAKQNGRNRYSIFDAIHDKQILLQRTQLNNLHLVPTNNEFCLYFQPKINMRNGRIYGAEALLRWDHPEHGILEPPTFLSSLAGTDLEIRIGNWVIDQTLKQLLSLHQQGRMIEISVNISAHHLQSSGFFDTLERLLSKYPDLPAEYLQLEVLESSVLTDIHRISSIIGICRDGLGVRIALDDFGTGYSSLSHLRHLPVDVIKIDQSFVRDIMDDPNDFTIVEGVIGLSHAFQHQVIAEGVESVEHGLMLMTIGCDMAQGFIIAQPMPAEKLTQWMHNYQPEPRWLNHARNSLSPQQRLLTLMQMQGEQWLQLVIDNLRSSPAQISNWPLMNPKRSHFTHWLEQGKQEELFNQLWLDRLKLAYYELFHAAASLRNQFEENEIALARKGIDDLQNLYAEIQQLLASPAQ
ncbi:MAG: EAL domain-containing protein [Gammaproteobacteria bacterium]|nr:EAL domain-containing protein [Gammaproteobacteria bacterium]